MNPDTYILDAQGRPTWSFGGYKTTYRGYDIFFDWLIEPKETQPVLIIQPTRKDPQHGAWGICLGCVGLYLDESGGLAPRERDLTPGAYALCERALETLGKAKLDIEVKNLMAVVHRWLPDLILMPPVPVAVRREETRAPLIEVELIDGNTGKTHAEASV